MRFSFSKLHAASDQWLHHGQVHIQPLLGHDKRITPTESGDVSIARRWAAEREAFAQAAKPLSRAPHWKPHMPTPREMAAVAGGHEGAGDTLGHRRRNDVPQPKHAERFRPGRPHQRRSLPWLTHALRHDADLRDDTAHPQPLAHAGLWRMHATRAAKRVPRDDED